MRVFIDICFVAFFQSRRRAQGNVGAVMGQPPRVVATPSPPLISPTLSVPACTRTAVGSAGARSGVGRDPGGSRAPCGVARRAGPCPVVTTKNLDVITFLDAHWPAASARQQTTLKTDHGFTARHAEKSCGAGGPAPPRRVRNTCGHTMLSRRPRDPSQI